MAIEIRWLGHGGWQIKTGSHTILLDPFLSQSPLAPCTAEELDATFVLVSHGHFDHISDVPEIVRRTGATAVAIFEIAQWLESQHGIDSCIAMNIGGGTSVEFGHIKMTPALHSSQLPDGSYGGEPAGFLLTIEGKKLYFACDTGLFSDMRLIGDVGIDLAVLPIGDLFTMGPEDSIQAIDWIRPTMVAPAHFNTWPPIEQDAKAWGEMVRSRTDAQPIVLELGESFEI